MQIISGSAFLLADYPVVWGIFKIGFYFPKPIKLFKRFNIVNSQRAAESQYEDGHVENTIAN